MRFSYYFGDWYIKRKILNYVKLYSSQQKTLDIELKNFMIWHQREVLPKLSSIMDQLIEDIESTKNSKIERIKIEYAFVSFESQYKESFSKIGNILVPILSTLNETQVQRSRELIYRELDELNENGKISEIKLKSELKEAWEKNITQWFGPINEKQMKLLDDSLIQLFIHPRSKYIHLSKRAKDFLMAFDDRKQTTKLLEEFFKNWIDDNFYLNWKREFVTILTGVINSSSPRQKAHFIKELKKWESTLSKLYF